MSPPRLVLAALQIGLIPSTAWMSPAAEACTAPPAVCSQRTVPMVTPEPESQPEPEPPGDDESSFAGGSAGA